MNKPKKIEFQCIDNLLRDKVKFIGKELSITFHKGAITRLLEFL